MVPRPRTPTGTISLQLSPDEAELLEVVLDGVQGETDTSPEYRETAFLLRAQLDGARYAAKSIAPSNDGSGLAEHDDRVTCPECAGRGRRRWQHAMDVDCTLCGGTGRVNAVIVDQMARMSAS